MLAGMTSRQFTEWMTFFKIENERVQEKIHGKKGTDPKSGKNLDEHLINALKDIGTMNKAKEANGKKRRNGKPTP